MTPRIGIFYLIGEKLLIDSAPLPLGEKSDEIAFHELEHEVWWARLVNKGIVPDTFYAEFPRGRVSYDRRSREFTFRADPCILRRERLVKTVMNRLHLPVGETKICADGRYRCGKCMMRDNLAKVGGLSPLKI